MTQLRIAAHAPRCLVSADRYLQRMFRSYHEARQRRADLTKYLQLQPRTEERSHYTSCAVREM